MRKKKQRGNDLSEKTAAAKKTPENGRRLDKHMRAMLDHLWGPTGSVILHIILVFILYKYLVWDMTDSSADFQVSLQEMDVREIDDLEDLDIPDLDDFAEVPDDVRPPDMTIDDRPPDPSEIQDPEMDTTPLDVLPDFQSTLVLPDLYASRTDSGRAAALGRAGRWGALTEAAVVRALEWLKRHQLENGSWEANAYGHRGVTSATGLALMAFLAHGETTSSERYGETVRKAIEFLLSEQEQRGPSGAFTVLDQQGVYSHGIATYAISEAYAMTAHPQLRESMDAAIRRIIDGQQPGGGFDYHFRKGSRRDTSIGGWMIQAMKAARMAGCQVEGLDEAIEKAAEDIKSVSQDSGRFGYSSRNRNEPAVTSIGALGLQLAGHGEDRTVVSAVNYLHNNANCSWEDTNVRRAMYKWFYTTQAIFHHGGSGWTQWNNQFAPAYINAQFEDGHWQSPGSRDNDIGPAFTTALGALTLQVYYRFLPTFQLDRAAPSDTASERSVEEAIDIDIDFL